MICMMLYIKNKPISRFYASAVPAASSIILLGGKAFTVQAVVYKAGEDGVCKEIKVLVNTND